MQSANANESACTLHIQLFGAFEARINGVLIPPLRSRKVQWLLALLVLRHNQALDRTWLAGTLWPESDHSQSLYNLRQSLSNLRYVLGETFLCSHASATNALVLDLNGANVDVLAFDAAIQSEDSAVLERAVALYRGPLLESCTDEWILSERRVREEHYLRALETLADNALSSGNGDAAVKYLRAAVQADALRERAQRALMQALADVGDYGAAVQTYRELRLLLRRELNTDPAPETVALFQRIREEAHRRTRVHPAPSAAPAPAPPRQLPCPLTPLIGRQAEVGQVVTALRAARLLTLTGPGGVGKTRLAIAVADIAAEEYADGVFFVDLAPLSDAALIPQAIASALRLRAEPNRSPLLTLQDHLHSKTLLLLLDNCEHLLGPCARLIDALLQNCSGARVLATSRQILGLTGETAWTVPPLTAPPLTHCAYDSRHTQKEWLSLLSEYEAVQLFVVRAQQAQPAFQMSVHNAGAVAEICAHLDGLPLALELAAARARSLPAQEINRRLDDRFGLLTGGSRAALPRQQTLRALIDWSYELLNDTEKTLLCRLSVFAGGWTLEAAEQISAGVDFASNMPLNAWDAFDTMTGLADKSLIICDMRGEEVRYHLLETVRQYAREHLEKSGEVYRERKAHRDYFLRLAEAAEEKLKGPEQTRWFQRLEAEHDNLRAALDFCLEAGEGGETGLRLAGALQQFWWTHGHCSEGRSRLAAALAHPEAQEPSNARAIAFIGAGSLAWMQGDYAAARSFYEEGLALGRTLGEQRVVASVLGNLGSVTYLQGDYAAARLLYEESLLIKREAGDKQGIANTLVGLGSMALEQGDYTLACSLGQESLALWRELGDMRGIARSLTNLGNAALDQGDIITAHPLYEESLRLHRELEDRRGIARSLNNLGNLASLRGEYAPACSLFEESLALHREVGDQEGIALTLCNMGPTLSKQGEYPAARMRLRQCLIACRELGKKWVLTSALEGCAELVCRQQQIERAAVLWGAAHSLREGLCSPLPPGARAEYVRSMTAAQEALGEKTFQERWEEGQAMTAEQVTEYALHILENG